MYYLGKVFHIHQEMTPVRHFWPNDCKTAHNLLEFIWAINILNINPITYMEELHIASISTGLQPGQIFGSAYSFTCMYYAV